MAYGAVGYTRLTADGVVGKSGAKIRVYTVVLSAGAGGAGELVLRNGTSDSGTIYVKEDGNAASHTKTYRFGAHGILFPDGCFYDKDTNNDAIIVTFDQEL